MFLKVLTIIFFYLEYVFSKTENCTIKVNYTASYYQPDMVVCRRNETYLVFELDPTETGAKCLDGTNYKFLLHKVSGKNRNKFHFHFEGAAFCGADGYETLESCYKRSLTSSGTSSIYGGNGSTYSKNISMGYASSHEDINPTFADWNIIFIPYCDGTNNQGYLKDPLVYNGTELWFRGYNNTISIFEYARQNLGLFDAETVLISGCSSGGTNVFVWASYLQDYIPKNVKLLGLSDGGLFMDVYSKEMECFPFRFYMRNLAFLINATNLRFELYRKCGYANSSKLIWKCMMPQYIYRNITVDFFIANSQFDEQQLSRQLGVYCLLAGGPLVCTDKELRMMAKFREWHLKLALRIKRNKPSWGFWCRSCFEHSYHFTWAWYGDTMKVFNAEIGISMGLRDALDFWYNKGKQKQHNRTAFIDLLDWKHNTYCVYDETYREQDFSNDTTL